MLLRQRAEGMPGVRMARRVHAYRSVRDSRTGLRQRMRELAQIRVRYGYRRIGVLLQREGWSVGPLA